MSYGVFERGTRNHLSMMHPTSFSPLLYKRDRVVEDYGWGEFVIPDVDKVVAPKQLGRRVRPRQGHMHEDLLMISVEEELPMDPNNVELRAYQDDIGRSLNYNHMNLAHMVSHMNVTENNAFSDYPHIRSWEERWNARQSGVGGSGLIVSREPLKVHHWIKINLLRA